ncbi:MAG: hypothetical protein KC777_21955 [Cyanobacteria bacterium HKST-UBA02]|nr:hypothetical protein [Cyanobacteria bacterium HKST-UBA02]
MFDILQITVKPIHNAPVEALDTALNSMTPAIVEQEFANGQYSYVPAEDGTYIVRVLDANPITIGLVKTIIEAHRFEIISEAKPAD